MWLWAVIAFLSARVLVYLLRPRPASQDFPEVRRVEAWSWDGEYRRTWHNGPSAFWLEPSVRDVQKMIEPHLGMFNELGRRIRRVSAELSQLESAEMGEELLLEIAAVSRDLDALEEAEEALPQGFRDSRFGNQINFGGFMSMGARTFRLEAAVPLPVYRLLRARGLGPEDGYEVHSCREDLRTEELIIELSRGDQDYRVMRVSPVELQMSMW